MENQYIDLHIHTVNSDGFDTVEEVLIKAESLGLSVVSITDHNSVKSYYQLQHHRDKFSGLIVPGVELSTTYNGELIEILGYGIDIDKINSFCEQKYLCFRDKQLKERLIILDTYTKRDIIMDKAFCELMKNDPEKLFDPNIYSSRTPFLEELKKHPENAYLFGGEEQMNNTTLKDFLRKHFGNPSSGLYVDSSSLFPSFEEVTDAIHDAGGYMFIAHCHIFSNEFNDALDGIVKKYGFDGLECYHSYFTNEQSEYTVSYCDKNNIWKSGGSDYHGGRRLDCVLGKSTGGAALEISFAENWLKGIKNYV